MQSKVSIWFASSLSSGVATDKQSVLVGLQEVTKIRIIYKSSLQGKCYT